MGAQPDVAQFRGANVIDSRGTFLWLIWAHRTFHRSEFCQCDRPSSRQLLVYRIHMFLKLKFVMNRKIIFFRREEQHTVLKDRM